jgi:FemAB-related protein (PEP-CTERM system-associated)
MSVKIQTTRHDPSAIDAFVEAHPAACTAHRSSWVEIICEGLKHRPRSLSAWRDGQVVGWLPMVEMNSLLFGRHLVSLPYVNEAGVLADEPETMEALIERAEQLGKKTGAKFVELRQPHPVDSRNVKPVRTDKHRMTRALPAKSDLLWGELSPKVRNLVRKGDKAGLAVRWGGIELLDDFYNVFSVNMRDLGTPVFPRSLFRAMLRHLGRDCELCLVDYHSKPVAAAILTHFRDRSEVPSASSLRQFSHTSCNMLMYWHLLKWSIERRSRVFDFGRSSEDSGTWRFKRQWGAEPQPTGWIHVGQAADARVMTKEDKRFQWSIELWKHLPVWLANLAGPRIVRGIP